MLKDDISNLIKDLIINPVQKEREIFVVELVFVKK
jgi:hypothetical protein